MAFPSGMETILRISGDVRVLVDGDRLSMIGEAGLLEVTRNAGEIKQALIALQSGSSIKALLAMSDAALVMELLKQLFEHHWLHIVTDDDSTVAERYQQVVAWLSSVTIRPCDALSRIGTQTVAILGVGGLGIEVLAHLIGLGLRSVILLDADVVEPSNLNRQYGYTPQDIGRPKALVAKEMALRQVPDAHVQAIVQYVDTADDLAVLNAYDIALLVNCADQPVEIESIVSQYAEPRKIATITGGVGLHRGYWGPLAPQGSAWNPSRSSCVRIGSHMVPKIRCTSSHGPYNSIIAALIAHDVFAYLTSCTQPRSLERRMTLDFTTMLVGSVDHTEEAIFA